MRTRKLRFLSALLAVAMMFLLTPTAAFADDGKVDIPVDGVCSVTVTESSDSETDENAKSGVQKAVEAKYNITNDTNRFDGIKNLTVTTADGVELGKLDFQFMSGVDADKSPATSAWAGESGTDYPYLRQLTRLDLTKAKCVDDTFPTKAFYRNGKIETVIFPETLVNSGAKTFAHAAALKYVGTLAGEQDKTIVFPSTMTTVGESSFYNDKSLECTLELPATISKIGSCAFQYTPIEGNITIYSTTTFEPDASGKENIYAFGQTNINSLTFEGGVQKIPYGIAMECMKLKKITISTGSDVAIGAMAFNRTLALDKIEIPSNVTEIGSGAFQQNVKSGESAAEREIVITSADTKLEKLSFADQKYSSKMYFPNVESIKSKTESGENCWYPTQTVTVNVDGGTVNLDDDETYKETGLRIPTKTGCEFAGWWFENDAGDKTELTSTAAAGKTYTAKWNKLYTVTFAYGEAGLTNTTKQVAEGNTVTKPEDPKADGYKFEGWYKNENRTEKFKFAGDENADTIANDTTIYAKWHKHATLTSDIADKTFTTGKPTEFTVSIAGNDDVASDETVSATPTWSFGDALEKLEVYDGGKWNEIDMTDAAKQTVSILPVAYQLKLRATFNKAGEYPVHVELKSEDGAINCTFAGTATVKDEEVVPEKTAKLTFTDDCTATATVNGETKQLTSGDQVPVGATVTLALNEDKVPGGMKFDAYVIDPIPADGKLTANGTTATFEMTEKDTSVKVNFVTADTDDSSWDAATIVTGVAIGAGTAVLAYHIGTELYAEQILGKGVAIPRTRADVALTAWQLAGKPEVAIEGEPLSEAAIAQKWAVESGLMQNDADGSFNPDKKMSKLKALKVLDAAKKMG